MDPTLSVELRDHGRPAARPFDELLRQLAGFEAAPSLCASIYLPVRWRDEQQRERVRLFVKEEARQVRVRLGDGEADDRLRRDLTRAEELVEERVRQSIDPSDRGLALFLSSPHGLELALRLGEPPTARLHVGRALLLAPLFALAARRTLVAAIDHHAARIGVATASRFDHLEAPESGIELPQRTSASARHAVGWRFAGHIGSWLSDAASRIVDLLRETRAERLVLVARPSIAEAVEECLPQRERALVLRVEHSDPTAADDGAIAELARAACAEATRAAVDGLLDEVGSIERGASGQGRVAVGAAAVVRAANEGRLRALVLSARFSAVGWRCSACGAVGEGGSASCVACGIPVAANDLGEALVRRAILSGARIDVLDRLTRLDVAGGVAATLRF